MMRLIVLLAKHMSSRKFSAVQAIRIVLACTMASANRYRRYIVPGAYN